MLHKDNLRAAVVSVLAGEKARTVAITKFLKCFFPEYDPRATRSGTSKDDAGRRGKKKHGAAVHHELELAATLTAAERRMVMPTLLPDTQKVLAAIDARGLEPIHGEVLVRDPVLGISGRIDLVAADADGHVVLIEYKTTNNEEWFYTPMGPVVGPLASHLRDSSPASQAVAQVMLAQLAACSRGMVCDSAAIVVGVSGTRWLSASGQAMLSLNGMRALHAAVAEFVHTDARALAALGVRGRRRRSVSDRAGRAHRAHRLGAAAKRRDPHHRPARARVRATHLAAEPRRARGRHVRATRRPAETARPRRRQ